MKLLILGGTQFVGRHVVETAMAAGHDLTLFNRGRTAAALFPQIPTLIGDRRQDLSALEAGDWDAVIDTCGYLPGEVGRSAALLCERVERYAYISSVSAYASFARPNDEHSPLGVLKDPLTEIVDGVTYGPLKAACEAALHAHFLQRALIVRPGLVVGPHDPTQRFSYWPARLAAAADGEPVLAPGPGSGEVQFIDARDLADFVVRAVETGLTGTFNLVTSPQLHTRASVLAACAEAAGVKPALFWAEEQRLLDLGVKPWSDLPLWLPAHGEYAAFMHSSNAAALAAGLRLRPLAETTADILAWWRSLPPEQQVFSKAGVSRERETELLLALR